MCMQLLQAWTWSEDEMEKSIDNKAIFLVYIVCSAIKNTNHKVKIEVPGNGTVKPGPPNEEGLCPNTKWNAHIWQHKRNLEDLLKKKVNNLLWDIQKEEADAEEIAKN